MSIPKVTVIAAGLVAAFMAATINPVPAQAFPRAASCTGCHADAAGAVSTVTAVPSTATPAPGATYTVAITMTANPTGGDSGYGIVAIAPTPAPLVAVKGGATGAVPTPLSYTATMIAPATAGTFNYTVWTNQGSTSAGLVGSKVFSITVAAAPVAVTTTTALAVSPATAVAPGSATLTASVTGAGAAGTVQFLNGTTVLGTSTVAVGSATLALTGVAAGSYSYTAKFIPTNAALFTSSTSSAATFVVTVAPPVVVTTTTALAVSPTAGVAPATANLTATVTGAGAAGTVEFFDGATTLGLVPVASGVATKALTGVVAGSYSYTAKFIPTNVALFTSSTSSAVAFVVAIAPPGVVTTTTVVAVSPATAVAPGSATLSASVTGAGAAGTVEFFDGATSLGLVPVASGVATKALTGVLAGSYSYTATFIPTNAALFTSSTSSAVAFVVTAAPPVLVMTTTALAVSPATAVAPGSATLTASVSGAGAAGSVEFLNGSATLGTSPVAAGVATKALTGLAAGSYSYTAKFLPTDATAFGPSTSTAVAFVVTVAPSQSTAKIFLISPRHGVIGARVFLAGQFFGTSGVVKFGNVSARTTFWSTNLITVTVPYGSVFGNNLVRVYPTGQAASNAVPFYVDRSYEEETDSGDLSATGLLGMQHLDMYNNYPSNCAACHNGLNRPKAPLLTIEDANMETGISCAACHAPGKSEADIPVFVTAMNDPAKVVYNRCSDCHTFPVSSDD